MNKLAEVKEELLNIMPNGTKLDDEVINDMPQFVSEYLEALMENAVRTYPHREEAIRKAYDHVITDMSDASVTKLK